MGRVKYYYSSVSSNLEIKKHQQKVEMILDSKKIEYDKIDIATDETLKQQMRDAAGPGTLPPQICNGDEYCGDYNAFEAAVECEELTQFLKLA